MFKRLAALLLAAGMVLGTTACGGGVASTGASAATEETAAAETTASHDTSTVTIAMSAEPSSMTWWDNEEMASIYSAYLTNSFLMKIDPDTMEPVPDLAESIVNP